MHNLFANPPRLPLVGASILAADFSQLGKEARSALDAGADLLHFDVMDGHFVNNLTMGPDMCRSLRRALPSTSFDVHLMVTDPGPLVDLFARSGANHLTFHIEAVPVPDDLAATIRAAGMSVGLAINPPTEVDRIRPFVEHVDLVLIMSVNPGYAGQKFLSPVLEKARAVKRLLRPDQRLAIDGGVNSRTAPLALKAGCDVLVAASAIFGERDYAAAIAALRGAAAVTTPGA